MGYPRLVSLRIWPANPSVATSRHVTGRGGTAEKARAEARTSPSSRCVYITAGCRTSWRACPAHRAARPVCPPGRPGGQRGRPACAGLGDWPICVTSSGSVAPCPVSRMIGVGTSRASRIRPGGAFFCAKLIAPMHCASAYHLWPTYGTGEKNAKRFVSSENTMCYKSGAARVCTPMTKSVTNQKGLDALVLIEKDRHSPQ